MRDKKLIINSVIPIESNSLIRVNSSISITNKLLFGDIEHLFNKAFCLMIDKISENYRENYLLLLETDTNHRKKVKYNFGSRNEKDYTEALNVFSEILNYKPKHLLSIEMSAICKVFIKNYSGAIENFSKAIEIDPEYASAYNGRGNAKGKLKDYHGAIDDFSKAIEIDP